MKKALRLFCCVFLMLCVTHQGATRSACAFTVGEEREVGEKLLFTLRSVFQLIDDPDIHQYITRLGEEVLEVAGVQFFDYRFFVIRNKEFNAFAAPSGLIFFHSGLIEAMNSEDELVSVLAHEIGHIVKRHLASRIEKGKVVNMTTLGLAVAGIALGSPEAARAVLAGSMAAGQSLRLHFSRSDEEEADLLACRWMKEAGRNPKALEKMLQTMRRITRYRRERRPQYLLTHPEPETRLEYVQSLLVAEESQEEDFSREKRFDFLRCKYRIMSMVKPASSFREYLAGKIADPHLNAVDVIMAKYGMAQAARLEGDFERSMSLLEEVMEEFPEKPVLQVDKGALEFESGERKKALATLTRAYDNDRRDLSAAFNLAKVSLDANDQERAEALFREVVDAMPEYSRAYFELGKIKTLRKHSGDAAYYLGKYYLYEGKHALSAHSFRLAVNDASTDASLKKKALASLKLLQTVSRAP